MTFSYDYDPSAEVVNLIPVDTRCVAQITDYKHKTDDGKDSLSLQFQVVEGQFTGQPIWVNMHFKAQNPKAVNIAKSTMNKIMKAFGKTTIKDIKEIFFKKLYVTIKHTTASDMYPSKEDVKRYEMHEETRASINAQNETPPTAVQQIAQQTGGTVVENPQLTQATTENVAPNWNGDNSWQDAPKEKEL